MTTKLHIYYDKESDYLELRFGEPTASHYDKIGPDTYVRIDEKTGAKMGYAIFNVQHGASIIDLDIPFEGKHSFKRASAA